MANFFLVSLIGSVAVSFIQSFSNLNLTSQRYIYWSCACIAAISGFFMAYPNWKNGIWLAMLFFGAMAVAAYCYTPYLKLNGRIHALTVQDNETEHADDSAAVMADPHLETGSDAYSGLITARKLWWLLLPLMVICAGNLYFFAIGKGAGWVAAISFALLIILAVGAGYGDASWDYAVARSQYVQFGIAAVVTVGLFPVVYLVAYCLGRRWPSRRKQSMEYRAHHRHRRPSQES